jgi:branched-subunit amino acid ABC-type transport system permease component
MDASQVLINVLVRSGELGLIAVGVTLVFSLLRFANFAHGELALIGAYLTYVFSVDLGVDIWLSIALSAVGTGMVAIVCDRILFARIRTRAGLVLLVASMGLSMFLRSLVSAIWGPDPYSYDNSLPDIYTIAGANITSTQVIIIALSIVAMLGFHFLLRATPLGRTMRALSDNRDLARARGVNAERIVAAIWFITGAFAAIGGSMIGLEGAISPDLGLNLVLPAFAAAILGGIGNIYGAVLGSVLIAVAENVGLAINWSFLTGDPYGSYLPVGYKLAIAFVLMLVVLIVRPRGLFEGSSGD